MFKCFFKKRVFVFDFNCSLFAKGHTIVKTIVVVEDVFCQRFRIVYRWMTIGRVGVDKVEFNVAGRMYSYLREKVFNIRFRSSLFLRNIPILLHAGRLTSLFSVCTFLFPMDTFFNSPFSCVKVNCDIIICKVLAQHNIFVIWVIIYFAQ